MGKCSGRDGGIWRGKKGSSAGVIGNDGCGRSMTAAEGRRTTKLVSRLRLQSKRGQRQGSSDRWLCMGERRGLATMEEVGVGDNNEGCDSQGERQHRLQVKSIHRVDAFGNSLGVCRKLAKGIGSLPGWRKGVRQKKTETHWKIIGGIGKLAGNVKGDCRKEDRRTYRKIIDGCRSMRELGLN
ncbi:hypothetical protein B296_00018425 [Ensete ventricosum]|uniref:Uncharacterized protein n=1 Tax=Ensete ventricosum TaxID=4639 RepID=A0A427A7S5_ENSVE|nr:hypothetical protein B296_00018425 [Ensete ventricosum]